MVKNSAAFFLDVNIIANVSPMENRSLPLDDARNSLRNVPYAGVRCSSEGLRFLPVTVVSDRRFVCSRKQENFSFGFLLGDILCSSQVCECEEDSECYEDRQISVLRSACFQSLDILQSYLQR